MLVPNLPDDKSAQHRHGWIQLAQARRRSWAPLWQHQAPAPGDAGVHARSSALKSVAKGKNLRGSCCMGAAAGIQDDGAVPARMGASGSFRSGAL